MVMTTEGANVGVCDGGADILSSPTGAVTEQLLMGSAVTLGLQMDSNKVMVMPSLECGNHRVL